MIVGCHSNGATVRRSDFTDEAPGSLVSIGAGLSAFVPNPLPPELRFNAAETALIADAERSLGQLAGAGGMLPNPELVIRPFLRKEAVLSSRIEGTIATVEQLVLFEEADRPESETGDVREVFNYLEALNLGIGALATGYPVSKHLIRQLHGKLMDGVRGSDQKPGEFRTEQNAIGVKGRGIERATYVPPPPTEVIALLDDLERFMQVRHPLPAIVQIALIHYQFESIHPFMDGNGRVGRLLISLLLITYEVMDQPLLYLSDFFDRNRDEYIENLLQVSQTGSWNTWIAFFARGVHEQSNNARTLAVELLDLWQKYRRTIQENGISARALSIVDWLFERPSITVPRAASQLHITQAAARNLVERLESEGIVKEVTGKPRNRIYVATEIVKLTEMTR
jgi:Fic family protein